MRVGSISCLLLASAAQALAFDPRIVADARRRAPLQLPSPNEARLRRAGDCLFPPFCPKDASSTADSQATSTQAAPTSSAPDVKTSSSAAPAPPTSTSQAVPTSTQQRSSSADPTSSTPLPTSTPHSSSSATPTSSSAQPTSSTIAPSSSSPLSSAAQVSTSISVISIATTDSASPTSSTQASSSSATGAPTSTQSDSGGNTGTIIGLSVAGGVGVLIVVGFIIWKLKKKRFSDFDDDDGAAIRWPELDGASAMHPLPARPTGRSGIETSALDQDEAFDGRGYADASTSDLPLQVAGGPYSVPPPGPHDQYYYDNTPHQSGAVAGGPGFDAYGRPISTDPYGGALDSYGRESAAYDHGGGSAYGGYNDSVYGGGAAGNERVTSPGPHSAYGVGGAPMRSASPGVGNAYANYEGHQGQRTTSPGPDTSYGYR